MLSGAWERRPHLSYEVLEEGCYFAGQRDLVRPARLHLWTLEDEPPFLADLADVLPDLDLRKCPEADRPRRPEREHKAVAIINVRERFYFLIRLLYQAF